MLCTVGVPHMAQVYRYVFFSTTCLLLFNVKAPHPSLLLKFWLRGCRNIWLNNSLSKRRHVFYEKDICTSRVRGGNCCAILYFLKEWFPNLSLSQEPCSLFLVLLCTTILDNMKSHAIQNGDIQIFYAPHFLHNPRLWFPNLKWFHTVQDGSTRDNILWSPVTLPQWPKALQTQVWGPLP